MPVRFVTRPLGDQGGSFEPGPPEPGPPEPGPPEPGPPEPGPPELIDSLRAIGIAVDDRARMNEKVAFIELAYLPLPVAAKH